MGATRRQIALLLSSLRAGGAQRRMVTLANAFAALGHRVDLVAVRSGGELSAELSESVSQITLDPRWVEATPLRDVKGPAVLASVPALARWLRRRRPDVLLSSSNPANLAALTARALAGGAIPAVISVNVHASSATGDASRHPALGWAMRRLYPSADGIIAISRGVAEDLAALLSLPERRIDTIYNPVDQDAIRRRSLEPLEDPWLREGAVPIVLGVGKLRRQKDFATLIRAFARLRRRRPARLLLLGEGPEREGLEALARTLGVGNAVRLAGHAPNPAAWMARAYVLALSSAWEGFSNVIVEALACGCPVVSTDCPSGPSEILEGGAIGPLVPVGDDAALASALDQLLARPHDAAKLRASVSRFTVGSAAERYLQVLERAVRAREPATDPVIWPAARRTGA